MLSKSLLNCEAWIFTLQEQRNLTFHWQKCVDYNGSYLINKGVSEPSYNDLKSRDITLPAKICIVKGMVFPVITYRCES